MNEGTCECGRPTTRGRYGFWNTYCDRPECAPDPTPRLRKRKRLSPFSVKALEEDFRSGLPR